MVSASARRTAHLRLSERWALAAILIVHVALGIYYSVTIPIWEAHDEIGHYYVARFVATEHRLPGPQERLVQQNDEARQPPLYYLLAAVPVLLTRDDPAYQVHQNPHMSRPKAQGGYNRAVHDAAGEAWPFQGTPLAVHAVRLVSVLLGAVVLALAFHLLRLLCPQDALFRWSGAALLLLWPQFRFASAVINNDIMAAAAGAAVSLALAAAMTSPRPRLAHLLSLCGSAGLALLSKNSTLALLPAVVLAMLLVVLRAAPPQRGRLAGGVVAAGLATLALVGWWYLRNIHAGVGTFGGPYGLRDALHIVASLLPTRQGLRWGLIGEALGEGTMSLWAGFGWNNLGLPLPLYWIAAGLGAVGLVGVLLWFLKGPARPQRQAAGLLLLAVASTLSAWLLFTIQGGRTNLPGRYLLPVLPALVALLALGWRTLLPAPVRRPAYALALGALTVQVLAIPTAVIRPAYAAPAPVTEQARESFTPVHARFGDLAELVGYRLLAHPAGPQGPIQVALLWRPLARTEADYSLSIKVLTHPYKKLGEVQRFPGGGALATSTWELGRLFAEEVRLPLKDSPPEGCVAWIEISYFNRDNVQVPIPVYDGAGNPVGDALRLGYVKLQRKEPASAAPVYLRFGPAMALSLCRVTAPQAAHPVLRVNLLWRATAAPLADYTVSLQLRDAEGTIVAQQDSQPQDGRFPTSYWEEGDEVPEQRQLALPPDLPAGTYGLHLCVYDAASMARLGVVDGSENRLAEDEALLLTVTRSAVGEWELAAARGWVQVADPESAIGVTGSAAPEA